MRKPVIAGNWKMHMTIPEALELVSAILQGVGTKEDVEVVVAPPYTALHSVAEALKGSHVALSAQNMHWEDSGAFTGEVSPKMLKDAGCSHVIIGHSERRQYFGETDESVNRRVKSALRHGFHVILCLGETLDERKAGNTFRVLEKQLVGGMKEIDNIGEIMIAYEPVWAIGTGMKATDQQANDAHGFIRSWIRDNYGDSAASGIRILYGGSVKPDNVDGLMSEPDVDGALVGGASLNADSFCRLVKFKPSVKYD